MCFLDNEEAFTSATECGNKDPISLENIVTRSRSSYDVVEDFNCGHMKLLKRLMLLFWHEEL